MRIRLLKASSKSLSIATLSSILIVDMLIEYSNHKKKNAIRKYLGYAICKLSRSFELNKNKVRFSGSVFVLLASILSVAIFSKEIAIFSISIMIISDASAALFGKAYGKIKIFENKTLEGSTAFFVSAIILSIFLDKLVPFGYSVIIACVVATIFEIYRKKLKFDDNLSVPLSLGIILTFL